MEQLENSAGPHSHALARFLRFATERPLNSPAWALAEALGKTLFPCDVLIRWEVNRSCQPPAALPPWRGAFESCEARWSVTERATREAKESELRALTWTDSNRYGSLELAKVTTVAARGIRIGRWSPSKKSRSDLEIVFLESGESFPSEKIDSFRRDLTGITTLYQAFAALQAVRLTLPRRAATGEFVAYIEECRTALDYFAVFPSAIPAQEQVVEELALEMFGLGWDVHNLSGPLGTQALKHLLRHIEVLSTDSPKLLLLHRILAASLGMRSGASKGIPSDSGEHTVLDLIARWTYLHAIAREVLRLGAAQGDWRNRERKYLKEAQACRTSLAKVLRDQLPSNDDAVEGGILSSWLRLWFCQTLLEELGKEGSSLLDVANADRWRFFAELAYVIRENLRAMLYGNRPEFKFQPVVFASALCTLVEQHALRVLQLPQRLDLGGLLREIGSVSLGGGSFFATGHLQHVLEMYIGGLFLCNILLVNVASVGLDAQFERAPISEVLAGAGAWRPGEAKQQEFRKAFGLAVLLHDIGMLLFPYWPRRAEGLAEMDPGLRRNLKGIRDVLNLNIGQLLGTCERELREAGIYDPLKDVKIKAWIEDCIEHGVSDHSVLGAWYLVRIARNAPGLAGSTLQHAARAILVHSIPTYEIRAEEDPVAALLVLCDELVIWREGHEPPQPNVAGRYFHSLAGEVRPDDTIYRDLRIPGLRIRLRDDHQALTSSLDLAENLEWRQNKPSTWPQIDIALKSPDLLPCPVYQLWLLASQNLGRIESSQSHWGPVLHMRSEVPQRQPPIGTRELLGRVVHRAGFKLRPCLQRWLELYDSKDGGASGFEGVSLGPADAFHDGRIDPLFPELERLVEVVLHEEFLRHQKPPTNSRSKGSRSGKKEKGRKP